MDYGIEVANDDFIDVESNFDANEVIETTAETQEHILTKKGELKDSQYNNVSMSSTLNLLNAFERSVKCESDTLFINNWNKKLVDPDRTTMLPSMVLESGNLFSNPMVEMPTVKGNVRHLRGFKKYAPNEDAKRQILKIVDLYESRKSPSLNKLTKLLEI